jgi:gluconolactonase
LWPSCRIAAWRRSPRNPAAGHFERRTISSLGMRSRADGMAIDSMGQLYVATAAGIQVVDPRGRHLGVIRVPAVVRNLAFAGPRRRLLYMMALESLYRVEMLSEGPAARAK